MKTTQKEKLLIVLIVALVIGYGELAIAQQIIYSEDFTIDPNFTLDYTLSGDEFFTWDSTNEIYKIRIVEEDNVDKFAYSPEFEKVENESFDVQIDLKLVESSFGMPIGVRFWDSNSTVDMSMHIMHEGSHDPRFRIGDSNGNVYNTGNATLDTWYTFKISYDQTTGNADLIVTYTETGGIFYQNEGVDFNPIGFNRCAVGWHTANLDGTVAEMHYDNISINLPTVGVISELQNIPNQYILMQNYPNPFNPITTISYQLPKATIVNLSIYNITGQLVETLVNENKNAGYHSIIWNASGVGSGLYFYRIEAGEYTETKKCLILK